MWTGEIPQGPHSTQRTVGNQVVERRADFFFKKSTLTTEMELPMYLSQINIVCPVFF